MSSGKQDLIYSAKDFNSSDILSEVLVLPEPKAKPTSKSKPALTEKIVCITDDDALENLRMRWKKKEGEEEKKAVIEQNGKEKEKAERSKEEEKCYH